MLPTSEDIWNEDHDPGMFGNNYGPGSEGNPYSAHGSMPMLTIERVYLTRFLGWLDQHPETVIDESAIDDIRFHEARDADPDEPIDLFLPNATMALFLDITNQIERAEVDKAIAAAKALIRCRVCGVVMTAENTLDPEVPDECVDCINADLLGPARMEPLEDDGDMEHYPDPPFNTDDIGGDPAVCYICGERPSVAPGEMCAECQASWAQHEAEADDLDSPPLPVIVGFFTGDADEEADEISEEEARENAYQWAVDNALDRMREREYDDA